MKTNVTTWKQNPISGCLFMYELVTIDRTTSINALQPLIEDKGMDSQDPWYVPLLEMEDSKNWMHIHGTPYRDMHTMPPH